MKSHPSRDQREIIEPHDPLISSVQECGPGSTSAAGAQTEQCQQRRESHVIHHLVVDEGLHTMDHLQLTCPLSRKGSTTSQKSILRRGGGMKNSATVNSAYQGKKGWLAWAMEIRSREKQRVENLRRVRKQKESNLVPEPIRKARFESSTLFTDSFKRRQQYLPPDGMQRKNKKKGKKKKKRMPSKTDAAKKFSDQDWADLYAFWEHRMFTVFRIVGVVLSVLALISSFPAILNTKWVKHDVHFNKNITIDNYTQYYPGSQVDHCANVSCYYTDLMYSHAEIHGIWFNCTENVSTFTGIGDPACKTHQYTEDFKLHHMVMFFLCAVCVLGFASLVVNIIGFIRFSLSDRIWSFHSAGEAYLVCGMMFGGAVILWWWTQSFIYHEDPYPHREHHLLWGFYIAWLTPALYFTAGLLLLFDDMIRCCYVSKPKSQSHMSGLYSHVLPTSQMTNLNSTSINVIPPSDDIEANTRQAESKLHKTHA